MLHYAEFQEPIQYKNLRITVQDFRDDDRLVVEIVEAPETGPGDKLQRRFQAFSQFLMLYPESLDEFQNAIREQLKNGRRRASALWAVCTVRRQHQRMAGRCVKPLENVYGTYFTRLALMLDPKLATALAVAPAWDDADDEQIRKLLTRWKRQRRCNSR